MTQTTCVDLFAGTGAFSYVLQQHGVQCVYANDAESASQAIYKANHPDTPFHLKDLHDVDVAREIPPHDILCAGFPCQPFSVAGQQGGFKDARANVFWKMVEVLEVHRPRVIVLENVRNLATHNKQSTFRTICGALENVGYHLHHRVLDTCKATHIPHHRERIYIVGFLDKSASDRFSFDFAPCEVEKVEVCDLLQPEVEPKYYYTDKFKVYGVIRDTVKKHIATNTLYQYRRRAEVRENKSRICPALRANMGTGGHNVPLLRDDRGIRKLTPRECFNLQGFPPTYILPELSDSALYKLAGNAVSVPVVERIVRQLGMSTNTASRSRS